MFGSIITGWRQHRVLGDIFHALKTSLLPPPDPMQTYCSDPCWKLAHSVSNWRGRELTSIVRLVEETESLKGARIDVREFFGSSNGKSTLRRSLREFAFMELEKPGRPYHTIGFETDSDWENNIKSFEERFGGNPPEAYHFDWSGKLYLVNSDQSHHFAALYRQALEQNRVWNVPCNLRRFSLGCRATSGEFEFVSRDNLSRYRSRAESTGISIETDALAYFTEPAFCYRIGGIQATLLNWAKSQMEELEKKGCVVELGNIERWVKNA